MQLAALPVQAPDGGVHEIHTGSHPHRIAKSPEELVDIISRFVSSDGWLKRVRLSTERRWYERLHHGVDYDIWLISWMPGQSTGFHDHGESAGAFVVATGQLEEHLPGQQASSVRPGDSRAFGPQYVHDVRNESIAPAISIHAYSPPLNEMNEYELDGDQLVIRLGGSELFEKRPAVLQPVARIGGLNIDEVLSAARTRLQRLSPNEVKEAVVEKGAVLVDIRPEGQRAKEGILPGALIVERNVLEWRFDPASSARLPIATDYDLQIIVFCSEGYTSSLAAAALQDLGIWRATDMVGGFHAWRAAGGPIAPPTTTP